MTVTSTDKDYGALALTLVAHFDAPVHRVWELWSDPRRLERWWGPPSYPATVDRHELVPGGTVTYFMTGPDGAKYHGYWQVLAVDAPRALEFVDGFADADGRPDTSQPAPTCLVSLSEDGGRTRMEIRSRFDTREDMERLLQMGVAEGMAEALGQVDELLAA
ncbi:SRPBCC family protein [Nakamurella endophytica]|uniref:Activator of HSP90 ATPase n=1 Tax=Nakamurella endophytica TaxID=1748367 RepID=A0A917T5Q0_9ACTN|nr:SRPBCC domain-containing protein [Nakamurella endophytica]GGM11116.1 activator of HSP90 ATPase [Nakamurella endophytica]